jgi:putative membrane protein
MKTAHRLLLVLAGGGAFGVVLLPGLHELSERLFSVHMVEHELLMAIAAPLIVLGGPLSLLRRALPQPARGWLSRWVAAPPIRHAWLIATGPVLAWSVHTLALWIWHIPLLFEAALRSEAVHALQHLSFLGAALLY